MTFDQTVLIWCLAIPAAIAGTGCLLASRLGDRFGSPTGRALVVSFSWWLAVTASLAGLQGWHWWPEEAWRQALWPLLAWVLWIGLTAYWHSASPARWVIAGCLSILSAMLAMPSGAAWQDALPLHRIWLAAIAVACLCNAFALDQLSRHGGHRWSLLVAIAGLAGPMALAASTYGSLTQWCFSMVVATAVMATAGIFSRFDAGHWTVAVPSTIAAAGIGASGRFYTYDTHPAWIYALMLMAPTIIVLLDVPLRRKHSPNRVLLSGTIATLIVGLCVWMFLLKSSEAFA